MHPMRADAFSLLMDTWAAVVELMAKCQKCGAITTQVLELAWRARMVTCTECLMSMPVDRETLNALRKQAVEAQGVIDLLLARRIA